MRGSNSPEKMWGGMFWVLKAGQTAPPEPNVMQPKAVLAAMGRVKTFMRLFLWFSVCDLVDLAWLRRGAAWRLRTARTPGALSRVRR